MASPSTKQINGFLKTLLFSASEHSSSDRSNHATSTENTIAEEAPEIQVMHTPVSTQAAKTASHIEILSTAELQRQHPAHEVPTIQPRPTRLASPPPLPHSRAARRPRQTKYDDRDDTDEEDCLHQYETEKYHRFVAVDAGGCAIVYSAISIKSGEEVAVKRPLDKLDNVDQFKREIEIAKEVQGPGIVEVKDDYEERGLPFLVMEKMDSDLFKILKEEQELSEADRKAIMKMALIGLKTVHDRGFIHQDVKPDNFFFTLEGGLKIGDFGRSSKDDGQPKYTNSYFRNYRPRELLRGGNEITRKSDLWALGSIHQELVMGRALWTNTHHDIGQLRWVEQFINSEHLTKIEEFATLESHERDFMAGLMQLDPDKRMTVDEALDHSWFKNDPAPTLNEDLPILNLSRRRGVGARKARRAQPKCRNHGSKRVRSDEEEDSSGKRHDIESEIFSSEIDFETMFIPDIETYSCKRSREEDQEEEEDSSEIQYRKKILTDNNRKASTVEEQKSDSFNKALVDNDDDASTLRSKAD